MVQQINTPSNFSNISAPNSQHPLNQSQQFRQVEHDTLHIGGKGIGDVCVKIGQIIRDFFDAIAKCFKGCKGCFQRIFSTQTSTTTTSTTSSTPVSTTIISSETLSHSQPSVTNSSSSTSTAAPTNTTLLEPAPFPIEYGMFTLGTTHIYLLPGDLLAQRTQAIVNAANETCLGGGGIDGIIHRAAGPNLRTACAALPERRAGVRCPTGEAVITNSFNLASRGIQRIIHTVGPIYSAAGAVAVTNVSEASEHIRAIIGRNPRSAGLLYNAYCNSLQVALENNVSTIAFPSISTGIFGYPLEEATQIALVAIQDFCTRNPDSFREVRLVFLDRGATGNRDLHLFDTALGAAVAVAPIVRPGRFGDI